MAEQEWSDDWKFVTQITIGKMANLAILNPHFPGLTTRQKGREPR